MPDVSKERSEPQRQAGNFAWAMEVPEALAEDRAVLGCLRLLTTIGFATAAQNWWVGERAGRENLPVGEGILAYANLLAAVAEALTRFHELVTKGVISDSDAWPEKLRSSWRYLSTPEVMGLRKDNLRAIRDRVAFHADEKPIKELLRSVAAGDGELLLWIIDGEDTGGFPDVAASVVGNWMNKHGMSDQTQAKAYAKILAALRDVTLAALDDHARVKEVPLPGGQKG